MGWRLVVFAYTRAMAGQFDACALVVPCRYVEAEKTNGRWAMAAGEHLLGGKHHIGSCTWLPSV
jgi:hypothetical protein